MKGERRVFLLVWAKAHLCGLARRRARVYAVRGSIFRCLIF